MMTNQGKDAIFAILFHAIARPGKRQELIKFLEWDREESMKLERGTLRFDVFQDPKNADAFYVYEAYEDAGAFEEHKTHPPYQRWDSVEFKNEVVLSHEVLLPAP
jgi:quinol monooxygenase YgiN